MLVACTSDIHVDISDKNRQAVDLLDGVLEELCPDVFVFAGDVSPDPVEVERFLRSLSGVKASKIFVSGNHDIWVPENRQLKAYDSQTKYYVDLKELCERNGFLYLSKEPVIVSDIAFVGTIGWFDYSTRNEFLDSLFPISSYESNQSFVGIWNDYCYAYWTENRDVDSRREESKSARRMADRDVARMLCSDLADQLRKVEGKVKQAVAVTHTVPFKELVKHTGDPEFDFFSAFIGNTELGRIITDSKIVKYAVCGHTHFPAEKEIGSVKCICSPIGYLDQFEGDLHEDIVAHVKSFKL